MLNRIVPVDMQPSDFISSEASNPYITVEHRMTRLLEDITNKIHELCSDNINSKQVLRKEDYQKSASTKAEISVKIPASRLTPEVIIERAEYVPGDNLFLRISYRTKATEILATIYRIVKLRIKQGECEADISPISIGAGASGIFENITDFSIPEWLKSGEAIIRVVVPFEDGSEAISKPYSVNI